MVMADSYSVLSVSGAPAFTGVHKGHHMDLRDPSFLFPHPQSSPLTPSSISLGLAPKTKHLSSLVPDLDALSTPTWRNPQIQTICRFLKLSSLQSYSLQKRLRWLRIKAIKLIVHSYHYDTRLETADVTKWALTRLSEAFQRFSSGFWGLSVLLADCRL